VQLGIDCELGSFRLLTLVEQRLDGVLGATGGTDQLEHFGSHSELGKDRYERSFLPPDLLFEVFDFLRIGVASGVLCGQVFSQLVELPEPQLGGLSMVAGRRFGHRCVMD
jgi:hypothetical protein